MNVHVYQSALRGDGFAWLLQKATEIGVSAVTPVSTRARQPADYASRLGRYRTIVQEAAEQCERSSLPTVGAPTPLRAALLFLPATGSALNVLLDEREAGHSLRRAVEVWRQDR